MFSENSLPSDPTIGIIFEMFHASIMQHYAWVSPHYLYAYSAIRPMLHFVSQLNTSVSAIHPSRISFEDERMIYEQLFNECLWNSNGSLSSKYRNTHTVIQCLWLRTGRGICIVFCVLTGYERDPWTVKYLFAEVRGEGKLIVSRIKFNLLLISTSNTARVSNVGPWKNELPTPMLSMLSLLIWLIGVCR